MSHFLLTPYFLDQPRNGLAAAGAITTNCPVNGLAPDPQEADVQQRVIPLYEEIKRFVHHTAAAGEVPVTLNGDCVMAIPVLAGLQAAGIDPLLLWFDAHGDFNNWETTPSGFLGGMPLAMMCGIGEQTLIDALAVRHLPAADVVLTDGRDLDPGEKILVEQAGIHHIDPIDGLRQLDLAQRPLWIHFDSDVLRLEDIPAVSYPAAGGPSRAEVADVFRYIRASGRIACISVSLPNPELDPDGQSIALTVELTRLLLPPEA